METNVVAGRYELGRPLGRGGASEVFAAHDRRLDRTVAIKCFDSRAWPTADGRTRFDAEGRLAAAVNHPNVVHVYDIGVDGDRPYIVMECLPGSTLSDALEAGPLPVARACDVIVDVLHGLGAAHAAGVVHRDLKPSNVLFDAEGNAKVGDFGIATSSELSDLTATGIVVGTPAYLAPERVSGERATVRSDLYAVGVMAYEALTGARPFSAESPIALAYAIHHGAPVTIRDLRPAVPETVAASVMHAMERQPADRYANADQFARALTNRDGARTVASPAVAATGALPVAQPRRRRVSTVPIVAVALLLAALAVGAIVMRSGSSSGAPHSPVTSNPSSTVPSVSTTTSPTVATTVPSPALAPAPKHTRHGHGHGQGGDNGD